MSLFELLSPKMLNFNESLTNLVQKREPLTEVEKKIISFGNINPFSLSDDKKNDFNPYNNELFHFKKIQFLIKT